MGISLFEETLRGHKGGRKLHDAAKMFYELCVDAGKAYQLMVVANKMKKELFIEYFISSHRHIDCNQAFRKNVHEANMVAIHHLFEWRVDLVKTYLLDERFNIGDSLALAAELAAGGTGPGRAADVAAGLSYHLSDEQMIRIADCANANCLFFCGQITQEMLKAFLDCRHDGVLQATNMRRVALLLGKMEFYGLLDYGWQTIIEKKRMLLSPKGKPVTHSDLSSALSGALQRMTVANKNICNEIELALQM